MLLLLYYDRHLFIVTFCGFCVTIIIAQRDKSLMLTGSPRGAQQQQDDQELWIAIECRSAAFARSLSCSTTASRQMRQSLLSAQNRATVHSTS